MKPIIAGNIVNPCIEFGRQTHEDVVTGPDAYPTAKQVGRVSWRWPAQRQVDNFISIFGYWILQSVSPRDTLYGVDRWRCRQRIAARPAVIRWYGHDADEVAFAMPFDIQNGKTIRVRLQTISPLNMTAPQIVALESLSMIRSGQSGFSALRYFRSPSTISCLNVASPESSPRTTTNRP